MNELPQESPHSGSTPRCKLLLRRSAARFRAGLPRQRSVRRVWKAINSARVVEEGVFAAPKSETVAYLRTLYTPELELKSPIRVRLTWDDVSGAYTAYDETFRLWYGLGPTRESAMRDLAEMLSEAYCNLESNAERLSGVLQQDLSTMRQVIAHAS
jgi:hypothetical protein